MSTGKGGGGVTEDAYRHLVLKRRTPSHQLSTVPRCQRAETFQGDAKVAKDACLSHVKHVNVLTGHEKWELVSCWLSLPRLKPRHSLQSYFARNASNTPSVGGYVRLHQRTGAAEKCEELHDNGKEKGHCRREQGKLTGRE